MKSELEKMLSGEEYDSRDPVLFQMRKHPREAIKEYNENPTPENQEKVFGYRPENLALVPPFQCEYGQNIKFGKNVFVNFNLFLFLFLFSIFYSGLGLFIQLAVLYFSYFSPHTSFFL